MIANDVLPSTLLSARASLESACDDLDDAVGGLADIDGDTVMASPGLVTLLLRVVSARRHVRGLELVGTTGPAIPLWVGTRQ
jgi:hypothetical protein